MFPLQLRVVSSQISRVYNEVSSQCSQSTVEARWIKTYHRYFYIQ